MADVFVTSVDVASWRAWHEELKSLTSNSRRGKVNIMKIIEDSKIVKQFRDLKPGTVFRWTTSDKIPTVVVKLCQLVEINGEDYNAYEFANGNFFMIDDYSEVACVDAELVIKPYSGK